MDDMIDYLVRWEGSKRLESFISEYCFSHWAKEFYGEDNISFNWYTFQPHKNATQLFIRFTDNRLPSQINKIDRLFTQYLLKKNITTVFAYYNAARNTFFASIIQDKGEGLIPILKQDAVGLFLSLSGKQTLIDVKEAQNREADQQEKQDVKEICSAIGPEDTYRLYLNRRFINEVLRPAFGRQPSDLDAVCLHNGKIRIFEFKRKTPAAGYMEGKGKSARFDAKRETDAYIRNLHGHRANQTEIIEHLKGQGIITYHSYPAYGLDWGHSQSSRWYLENGLEYCLIHWHKEKTKSIEHIDPITWSFKKSETICFRQFTALDFLGFNITSGPNSGMNGNVRIQDMVDAESFIKVSGTTPFSEVFDRL